MLSNDLVERPATMTAPRADAAHDDSRTAPTRCWSAQTSFRRNHFPTQVCLHGVGHVVCPVEREREMALWRIASQELVRTAVGAQSVEADLQNLWKCFARLSLRNSKYLGDLSIVLGVVSLNCFQGTRLVEIH